VTRFGSRSAQSFKPPAPSAAPSSQRPALPALALDIAPAENQPRAFATRLHVSIALSALMETPSSSTTTPSPLLGYLRPEPGPSSSKIIHRPVDMAEVQERQQAVQKFLAGAEMSKVCVSPRSTPPVDPQTRPFSLNPPTLCLCVWVHACLCADPLPVGVFTLIECDY
jgi:hypothetical protein